MRSLFTAARAIGSLAPEPLRSSLNTDGLATLADVCARARAEGRLTMARTMLGELWSLIAGVVRARLGRPATVTGGRGPHRRPPSGAGWLDRAGQDLRHAWRGLAARPGHAVVAVATLALGIGINTAVFSVLDAVLIRPVPYRDADRLATLWRYQPESGTSFRGGFAPPVLAEWRRQTDLVDRVEGAESRSFIYTAGNGAHMLTGSVVTPGLMRMLDAEPMRGRVFADDDGRAGTDQRVVLSERFWRASLGADPEVVGRTVMLDGRPYDVVGVVSDAFRYPNQEQDLWVPLDVDAPPAGRAAQLTPLVRLVDGVSFAAAEPVVLARGAAVLAAAGARAGESARLMALGRVFDDRARTSLMVLGGAVVLLLLIVCANLANLTLARALARARDRAVRSALGASRARLVRVAFVEHAIIGVAGAVGAVWIASVAIGVTVSVLPEAMTVSSLNAIDLDLRSLIFLAGVAVVAVLLVGVPPAWLSARASVLDALRRETRATAGSAGTRRARSALVVAEVALSIVLLVGAALMTRTVIQLQAIDIGLDADDLLAMELALPAPVYSGEAGAARRDVFVSDLLAELARDPDVVAASVGPVPPRTRMVQMGALEAEGAGPLTDEAFAEVYDVWPGYFETAGITLVAGRGLRDDDVPGAAVVNEVFAARHLDGAASALGTRFRIGASPWRTVVGVARPVRAMSEDAEDRLQVYYPRGEVEGVFRAVLPSSQVAEYRTLLVRTAAPERVSARLERLVHGVDASVITAAARPVAATFADDIARPRIVFVMMTTFAVFGLLLAAAGLYAVLSHLVTQRLREVGIRMALGATPRDIGRVVLGSGLGMTALGVVLGLAAAIALAEQMQSLLYEVAPFDPATLAGVTGVLVVTAAVATWRPARRAMRADPVTLLRDE